MLIPIEEKIVKQYEEDKIPGDLSHVLQLVNEWSGNYRPLEWVTSGGSKLCLGKRKHRKTETWPLIQNTSEINSIYDDPVISDQNNLIDCRKIEFRVEPFESASIVFQNAPAFVKATVFADSFPKTVKNNNFVSEGDQFWLSRAPQDGIVLLCSYLLNRGKIKDLVNYGFTGDLNNFVSRWDAFISRRWSLKTMVGWRRKWNFKFRKGRILYENQINIFVFSISYMGIKCCSVSLFKGTCIYRTMRKLLKESKQRNPTSDKAVKMLEDNMNVLQNLSDIFLSESEVIERETEVLSQFPGLTSMFSDTTIPF